MNPLFLFVCLSSLFLSSCSNDENAPESNSSTFMLKDNKNELDLTGLVLKKEVMDKVVLELGEIRENISENDEEKIKLILQPVLENGKQLHLEMLSFLLKNGELDNLTPEDLELISNLTDEQLIELSFVTYNQSVYSTSSIDWPRVRSCASFALGIQGIKTLYTNTLALGTVETMVGALKLIDKRYLGYVGIALMVYDFMDCLYGE